MPALVKLGKNKLELTRLNHSNRLFKLFDDNFPGSKLPVNIGSAVVLLMDLMYMMAGKIQDRQSFIYPFTFYTFFELNPRK